jgi:hypothetical protein
MTPAYLPTWSTTRTPVTWRVTRPSTNVNDGSVGAIGEASIAGSSVTQRLRARRDSSIATQGRW